MCSLTNTNGIWKSYDKNDKNMMINFLDHSVCIDDIMFLNVIMFIKEYVVGC